MRNRESGFDRASFLTVGNGLSLPDYISLDAWAIYNEWRLETGAHKNTAYMAAAFIKASRRRKRHVEAKVVCKKIQVDPVRMWMALRSINKDGGKLVLIEPEDVVMTANETLRLSQEIRETAIALIADPKNERIKNLRLARSVAAGAIAVACEKYHVKKSQEEIARACGASVPTLAGVRRAMLGLDPVAA
jgi:transcription initiation factor TFIIIB Brf1 subunit/transcription initiation factor TFIIB